MTKEVMTDKERGALIIITFGLLKEWVKDHNGRVNMLNAVVHECDTIACLSGWLFNMMNDIWKITDDNVDNTPYNFNRGIEILSKLLDIPEAWMSGDGIGNLVTPYWPINIPSKYKDNVIFPLFFKNSCYKDDISIDNICNMWMECGCNLFDGRKLREPVYIEEDWYIT